MLHLLFTSLLLASVSVSVSAHDTIAPLPVVIWHGMGDTCCNPLSMGSIVNLIQAQIPGVYVHSLQIGANIIEDELNGFLKPIAQQIDEAAAIIKNDTNLANGFHAIGFSQGGQFLRAYVQKYNNPPVRNLISVGGQHQGVFGMPQCAGIFGQNNELCELMRDLLNIGAYVPLIQDILVQAQYWHDPLNRSMYLSDNIWLPDINNELPTKNPQYKANLLQLDNFVMVKFNNDTMVEPVDSEWFGFYVDGQDKVTQTLQQSTLYTEDWLGLQQLDKQGKLAFLATDGNHLRFTDQWFIDHIIPYLNQTSTAIY